MADGVLVLDGAEVAEGAVQAAGVVPAFDVVEDRAAEPGARRPGAGVDELAFDRREEALGHRVVPALTGATDRQHDTVGPGGPPVVGARVLTAPVGVEDRPGWRSAGV